MQKVCLRPVYLINANRYSGYDVWLGNNRCGFKPEHTMLKYSDPRMWAWNIRQMGVIDLSALVSRVLGETGFEKLGLICHSQGTTETFVALAKGQRPDLGDKISVFCALAPAAYAGPLIGKMYFKFMRIISPMMFRVFFGIHAFIPFMMTMHQVLPGRLYGAMGYRVFSFLFNWTDDRWEQDLRDRMFQFAPVYVSAESMRWWLGRECFAKHRCILSTKEEARKEDVEDEEESSDDLSNAVFEDQDRNCDERHGRETGATAWYDEHVPPFALWIAGSDDLVDGNRLLRRFERGREPFVKVVHAKVIPEYEHLDVIWAMDSIEKVGNEVRSVIWQTAPDTARRICRTPKGCEGHNDKT
jgi:pimeloyl-ACP methyl ester carboxylesterase